MTDRSFETMAGAVIAAYLGKDPSFANRCRYWIDFFGQRDITSITTDDIEDGVDALVKRGATKVKYWRKGESAVVEHTGKPLAPASVNRYISTLGTIFKNLRQLRLLPRGFVNPMRGVGRLSEGEGRIVQVTVADVRRLVAAARVTRNKKLAALVAMACTTGWRLGTLQALQWKNLDLKARLADTLTTKNGTPHRTPILPWVVEELVRIRPDQVDGDEPVFGVHTWKKSWEKALQIADLPPEWTFHHCRHIAASVLAQSGASTVTIMQALNHKTPLMAMRYSHLNVDALRESIGRAWG